MAMRAEAQTLLGIGTSAGVSARRQTSRQAATLSCAYCTQSLASTSSMSASRRQQQEARRRQAQWRVQTRAYASEAEGGDPRNDRGLRGATQQPGQKAAPRRSARFAAIFGDEAQQSTAGKGKGRQAPGLSLEFFLLRGNIVKLYRDFLRASRNIPNPQARRETVDWLRDEHFEGPSGLRHQTDVERIRELLVAGNAALKRICGPMELVAALNPEFGSFPKLRGRRQL